MERAREERITSLQNARVKNVVRLSKRRVREEQRQTVVEGVRESARALSYGIVPTEAFICPELLLEEPTALATAAQLNAFHAQGRSRLAHVSPDVFSRLAYRGDSGGILLVIPYRSHTLEALPMRTTPFFALIEGIEKPGNLGAILRTADAAGVDGVILCTGEDQAATDLHNPNVIRASLGTVFSVPIVETTSRAAVDWLHANKISIIAATPAGNQPYTAVDASGPTAVALGSEAHGLSELLLQAADVQVHIPMVGIADSLNLATSAALMLYEVVRQRGQTQHDWSAAQYGSTLRTKNDG